MPGAWPTKPRPGSTARKGLRSRLSRTARGSIQADGQRGASLEDAGLVGCGDAEAGGSPSSEAPPEEAPAPCRTERKPGSFTDGGSSAGGTQRSREATPRGAGAIGNRAAQWVLVS
jgi:hypothetical protein